MVLLNTCSVRDQAEQKAIGKMGMLNHALQRDRPEVVFGFLGCMAQSRGAALLTEVPRLDLVVGTQKFHRVADYVDEAVARRRAREGETTAATTCAFPSSMSRRRPVRRKPSANTSCAPASRARSCRSCRAATCAARFASCPTRAGPRALARASEEIVAEVRALVAGGVKEVTLLGQIVNLYGRHEFPKIGRWQQPVRATARRRPRGRGTGAAAVHVAASHRVPARPGGRLRAAAAADAARPFPDAERQRPHPARHAPALHGGALRGADRTACAPPGPAWR